MLPQTARRLPRLALIFLAANYVSATLVLSNFEDISKKSVTSSCRSAYNTPLTNCDPDDFGNNSCSSSCKTSIEEAQSNIQSECADVTLSSGSLLSRAQEGKLVRVICKNGGEDDSDETAATTATTLSTSTKSNQNQMLETSTITRKSSTDAIGSVTATASDTKQTTSLVLAGDDPTGSVASAGTGTSAAESTSTSKSSNSGGGDPFASNDTGAAGRSVSLGYASLVVSAVACLMAMM